ncbi:hypothetical protein EBU91_03360 [bacterium]|nr:hypothetical protein [bacterium]
MNYELQKIVLKNCSVYNILFEGSVLGHILMNENFSLLVQNDEIPIAPIVESFGFSGNVLLAKENGYESITLNPSEDLKAIYEFKVINLQDQILTEEVI